MVARLDSKSRLASEAARVGSIPTRVTMNYDNMLNSIPEKPGIYVWYNKINNKCYVGQAINLYNRIKQHLKSYKVNSQHKLLYYAINKYGIENFEVLIVKTLVPSEDIKEQLDNLEQFYINRYNCLNCGYNCSLGGEGNLGFAPKEDTREKQKIHTYNREHDGRHTIYIKDVYTDEILTFDSCTTAAEKLNIKYKTLKNAVDKLRLTQKRYIVAKTVDNLYIKERSNLSNEYILEIIKNNLDVPISKLAVSIGISEQRARRLKFELVPPKEIHLYKIIKDQEIHIGNKTELANIIGVNTSSFCQATKHTELLYRGWKIIKL